MSIIQAAGWPIWPLIACSVYAYGSQLEGRRTQNLREALVGFEKEDGTLLIKADAITSHPAVVNVLEAARFNGITKFVFATQSAIPAQLANP